MPVPEMDDATRTALEAAAFRRLVQHLREQVMAHAIRPAHGVGIRVQVPPGQGRDGLPARPAVPRRTDQHQALKIAIPAQISTAIGTRGNLGM